MKIVHVETGRHFYGGAQQVAYLIGGLKAAGVDNALVCLPGSDIDAVVRPEGTTIFNISCAGDLDFRFAWWLRKVLLWEKPDILHCHSRRGADFLGGLAAAVTRVPAVISRRVDHTEAEFVARMRYRPYRKVIAISENVAAVLDENGVADDRIRVIRSAVDFERFQVPADVGRLRREFGIAEHEIVMAAIGQLIPRKGHRYLLDAMAGIRQKLPQARLIVFGRGTLEAELAAQAAALGLGDSVQFAGFRDDLDGYIGAFDLVVHPALREGLGVALLKAASAGVPVVAFDVAGSREAVVDGETGLLVTPKDTAALESAILQLAGDAALHKRLSEAARARMREEFSIEAMVDQHIQLYESVLHDGQ